MLGIVFNATDMAISDCQDGIDEFAKNRFHGMGWGGGRGMDEVLALVLKKRAAFNTNQP